MLEIDLNSDGRTDLYFGAEILSAFGGPVPAWETGEGRLVETRPNVRIIAGATGTGELVLEPLIATGDSLLVGITGLTRSNLVVFTLSDLVTWEPVVTNSVPFRLVLTASTPGGCQYFRASVGQ